MNDETDTTDALLIAVRDVLSERGVMANRVIVLAETIEPDGDTALWSAADHEMPSWDSLGMLTYALELERAAVQRRDQP